MGIKTAGARYADYVVAYFVTMRNIINLLTSSYKLINTNSQVKSIKGSTMVQWINVL